MIKSKVKVIQKDKGLDMILNTVRNSKGGYTKVGFPAEGSVSESNPVISTMSELATVAAVHEFGAPNKNIPERSIVRGTIDSYKKQIKNVQEKESVKLFGNQTDPKTALSVIGEFTKSKMQERIRGRISPALKQRTIERKTVKGKSGDVPLIDTGQMIQSIQHVEVV